MNDLKDYFFDFTNYSFPKFPANISAKFCFENELLSIPNTEAFLNVDKNNWVLFDQSNDNIFSLSHDQFCDIYIASNTRSQKYFEFIVDSKTNNYEFPKVENSFDLFEEIFGDLIEKEVPIKNRWRLIVDLFFKRKIYLSKYL